MKAACVVLLATVAVASALSAGGASANSGFVSAVITQPSSGDCQSDATIVEISSDLAFVPETVNVALGTTVCWRNLDSSKHTVRSDGGVFNSGDIAPSETYSFTFDALGHYAYRDAQYPQMMGTVTVDPPPPPLGRQPYCPRGATLVEIRTFGFDPATISVPSGTIVCWSNQDGWEHTVTSDTGAFDSGLIGLSWTYSYRFDTPGSYAYHDALYPCLTGTVYVDTDPPPPVPPPPCQPRNPTPCPTGTKYVEILHRFTPATIYVDPGTTVCWWNRDGWSHTVTSDTGAFDSGDMGTGSTYSFTFNAAGSYAYHDALYPSRTGTVNVGIERPPPARTFIVPRVIGLKVATARSRIRRSKGSVGRVRRARSRRVGRVIAQKPAAGKRLARGARVNLVVGRR